MAWQFTTNGAEKIFPLGKGTVYGPCAVDPDGNTTGTYTAEYFSSGYGTYTIDAGQSPKLDSVTEVEYWTVDRSGSVLPDAQVKLYWRDHSTVSQSGRNFNELRVAHYDGSDWNHEGNTFGAATSELQIDTSGGASWGWIKSHAAADFSPFTIGWINTSVPVTLIALDAQVYGETVKISWKTASEINNDFFTVERSKDGLRWEEVIIIPGAGNSLDLLFYNITDYSPLAGTSYYRLKQTDFDGAFEYSDNVYVNMASGSEMEIWPNPSQDFLFVTFNSRLEADNLNVLCFNSTGQKVAVNYAITDNRLELDIQDLETGMYYINIKSDNQVHTVDFVKN